jgi:phage FluMu protein Com
MVAEPNKLLALSVYTYIELACARCRTVGVFKLNTFGNQDGMNLHRFNFCLKN